MGKFRAIRFDDFVWWYDTICQILFIIFLSVIIILPSIGGVLVILWLIVQWIGIVPSVILGTMLFITIYKEYKIIPMED